MIDLRAVAIERRCVVEIQVPEIEEQVNRSRCVVLPENNIGRYFKIAIVRKDYAKHLIEREIALLLYVANNLVN